ncbi:hypothetical protein BGZ95_011239 [Linnemannia exigua]|uniref:Uncharacterized protein n=1 Tax=Linnemannia exigua TaxID=604196 RepID=A0AAD4DA71_9FUNG|nr:hypothetical protein BGZ95_011239 [Linnemannia exigua]
MALLPDPPTPTMSQGGASNSSQASLMNPSSTPSRAPQNITDHPDMFPSPDVSARGPQVTDENSQYIAPLTAIPLTNRIDLTPPPPPPNNPHDCSPAPSSLTNPHTQAVDQGEGTTWDSNAYIAPIQSYYSSANAPHTSSGATVAPVSSPTYAYNTHPNGSTHQTYQPEPQQQTTPLPNYYQQEQQAYQNAYSHPIRHQDPYSQQQQEYQHYATPLPYPQLHEHQDYEPAHVDTLHEKIENVTPKRATSNGKRKRLYWIGGMLIVILLGVVIGLVVNMNKDKGGKTNNNDNNSNSSAGSVPTASKTVEPGSHSSISVPVGGTPSTSSGAVIPPTGVPVIVPTPISGGGGGGDRVPTPPLPDNIPAKGQCPFMWCDTHYYWPCKETCLNDGDMKRCKAGCKDTLDLCL